MKLLAVIAMLGLGLVGSAYAHEGALLLCVSTDREVIVRAKPQVGRADIIKAEHHLPSYTIEGCDISGHGDILMNCVGTGNRTFILNRDFTGRYIGSHETREMTCQHSGHSAD
jgi:hypothetical protein